MKILALETSGTFCSVGLLVDNQIFSRHESAPMRQTQLILSMIDEVIKESGIKLIELDAIAFGNGPGSFTGVRLATSVSQGLGFALNRPLIAISSLAAYAQTAYNKHHWDNILVAIDARMQEVYWATYQIEEGIAVLMGHELVGSPESIPPLDICWSGVGNAWINYPNQFRYHPEQLDSNLTISMQSLLFLAKKKFISKEILAPEDSLPQYLRNNIANKSNSGGQ